MKIDIRARGFELTEGLREHTERRLRFALGWARSHVRKVAVRLDDLNGPRGGEDKRCHLRVAFEPRGGVAAEDVDCDLYVSIDRAAGRVAQLVARHLERQRPRRGTVMQLGLAES